MNSASAASETSGDTRTESKTPSRLVHAARPLEVVAMTTRRGGPLAMAEVVECSGSRRRARRVPTTAGLASVALRLPE